MKEFRIYDFGKDKFLDIEFSSIKEAEKYIISISGPLSEKYHHYVILERW